MRLTPALIAIASFALPTAAFAQLLGPLGDPSTGFGIQANTSTAANCPSFCTDFEFDSDGGEFILTASSSENTNGTARSSGFYDASETFLPVLRGFSSANAITGAFSSVFGAQRYTFNGTSTQTITVDFELDSIINQGTGNPDSTASAEVIAYRNGGEFITDFGTLRFESSIEELDFDSAFLSATGAATGQLVFDVEPGDVFWVAAGLRTSAERGGLADSENTFTASFVDATGLIATGVPVPEPASAALIALSSVALLGRRRAA